MRCPSCDCENPLAARFCIECGAAFPSGCPKCGFENLPRAKFCAECGTSLSSQTAAARPAGTPAGPGARAPVVAERSVTREHEVPQGERKTLTMLFADVKGSTELMENLDPDEARALMDPVLRLMIEAVNRYDGYIVQSTGDGIFALFGAPVAHEDHPQRAIYAALGMRDELLRYSNQLRQAGKAGPEVRIGLHTGEVVVRSIHIGGHNVEYTPVGHSTNVAARMQTLAPAGSIAVTEQLRALTEGYFEFKDLGPVRVKGVRAPVKVYEVLGAGPLRTRLEVAARRGLSKFVGRGNEIDLMVRVLDGARDGHGQVVAAVAEAGLGKSRLLHEFKALAQDGCLLLEAFCVPHGKASAYLPIIELLKNYFRITGDDPEPLRREKITGKVSALDPALQEAQPYLLNVLGLPQPDDSIALMHPQIRRTRTHEAIKRILLRESLNQPLIIIFEDLHWIDGETQAWLNLLVDSIANARVLLLVSYRPEYRHEWNAKSHYLQLRLDPLSANGAREMLDALAGKDRKLEPLKRFIVEKAEGNPLFVEEMLHALDERGLLVRDGTATLAGQLTEIKVPTTVQGILASRIDRLPSEEKDLLQTLAVIGRQLPLDLVRKVVAEPDDELERMLSDLKVAEFIYEQPSFPNIEYSFKHALTQEVAYGSLLAERRAALHEKIGDAIEAMFAGGPDDHLTDLAHHYRSSHNGDKAIKYLELLGLQLLRRSAYAEALGSLNDALERLKKPPATLERKRKAVDVGLAICVALTANKGYAGREVQELAVWLRELSREFQDPKLSFKVLFLSWQCYTNGADFEHARETGEQLMHLAESNQMPAWAYQANFALGLSLFWSGQLGSSRAHLERVLTLYSSSGRRRRGGAQDQGVMSLSYLGWLSWILGYPDRAVVEADRAVQLANEISQPFSLAVALLYSSVLRQFRREPERALELAQETMLVSSEHGFPVYEALGTIWCGWALVEVGQVSEGIARMLEASAQWKAIGQRVAATQLTGLLAQAYLRAGDFGQALRLIDRALTAADSTGEHFLEPELYRIQGEAILREPGFSAAGAQASFEKAIEIAHKQQAMSHELRATLNLADLLRSQGSTSEAHKRLSSIYARFGEGFETRDLKDAQALLAELS